MDMPPLHPLFLDRIESERCPDCGIPGVPLRRWPPFLTEWACPVCDADQIEEANRHD